MCGLCLSVGCFAVFTQVIASQTLSTASSIALVVVPACVAVTLVTTFCLFLNVFRDVKVDEEKVSAAECKKVISDVSMGRDRSRGSHFVRKM